MNYINLFSLHFMFCSLYCIMADYSCDHTHCTSAHANKSVCQTLSEMDWERGIWNAALSGDKEKVERIIRNATDSNEAANKPDNTGYTALHYAARNGHVDICKLLLQNAAKINAQTKSGKATPLHKAAVGGKVGVVKLLIEHGANVAAQDDDGSTALHKAAQFKHQEVADVLLKACPELAYVKDNKGNVAIFPTPTL